MSHRLVSMLLCISVSQGTHARAGVNPFLLSFSFGEDDVYNKRHFSFKKKKKLRALIQAHSVKHTTNYSGTTILMCKILINNYKFVDQ